MDYTIGIVIPVYNGSLTVGNLVDKLMDILPYRNKRIILVNDGSVDDSHEICLKKAGQYPDAVTYLALSKNFGEHNAVMAGLNYVDTDYVVIMDDDFQNPPEEAEKLINAAIDGGYDVTYSYYKEKRHSFIRNLGSRFNDMVATFLLNKPHNLYLSSFKCINRFTVNEVIKYKGPFPYIDGLILRVTKNMGKIMVRHDERWNSRSNYTLKKLIHLWLNMFVNFSVVPLRISIVLGFLMAFIGAMMTTYVLVERIFYSGPPLGWASLMIALITFSGIQLFIIGLMGEYLGRLFLTENKTPQYAVRNVFGAIFSKKKNEDNLLKAPFNELVED